LHAEHVYVVNVLALRNHVVEGKVRAKTDEVPSSSPLVRAVTTIHSDDIVLVMKFRQKVLRVLVPLRKEEDAVENHVGHNDSCSVLLARPPRRVAVKSGVLFVEKPYKLGLIVPDGFSSFQYFIFVSFEGILELDPDLRNGVAVHTKVDGAVQ
jgi:hypothetical protein